MSLWTDVTAEIVEVFAVDVTYTPSGGSARIIRAAFENGYRQFDLGGVPVESNTPELSVATENLPTGAARGDAVSVDGVSYTVRDIRPDGHGLTVLTLTEAA